MCGEFLNLEVIGERTLGAKKGISRWLGLKLKWRMEKEWRGWQSPRERLAGKFPGARVGGKLRWGWGGLLSLLTTAILGSVNF